MIAYRKLRKAGWKRIYMTPQEVRDVRQNLETKTGKAFEEYVIAKRNSQARAPYVILD